MLVTLGLTLGIAMWVKSLLSVGFLFVCIILILTVLIQKPSGGGLSGAFGAASGSGQTAFGAKTGDALTIFTIIMFVIFVLGGIGMKFVTTPSQPGPPAMTSGAPGGAAPADVGGPARPPEGTPPVPGPGLPDLDEEGAGEGSPAAPPGEIEAPAAPQGEPGEPQAGEPGGDPQAGEPGDPEPAQPAGEPGGGAPAGPGGGG